MCANGQLLGFLPRFGRNARKTHCSKEQYTPNYEETHSTRPSL